MELILCNIRLDLFDGGSAGAGAAAGSGEGGSAAPGATSTATSGATNSEKKAGATPTSRSRRSSGVYDNVKFGKQPAAEVVGENATGSSSDAGNNGTGTAESAENKAAEADKKVDAPKSREERRRAYDEYIKGEGKEFYAEDTKNIISKRVRDFRAVEEKMAKLQPFMDALGDKYNLSSDDLEGLMKAIQGDRDFFTDAALEAGMDNPETYRKFREAQRQTEAIKKAEAARKQAAEAARRQDFVQQKTAAWKAEADALKGKYPSFNFEGDIKNPQFTSMLRAGVSVEAAYRALHHDEIVSGAVNDARAQTEKALVDNIRAKGARPQENGTSNASTFTYKSDPSKFSKADRAEIARRVARGEKIVL
jgi:hypothetical protein